ncbi:MAG: membrane protein insertase YidC [Azospira oryzae]|nr:MAG: membrane protein insertase YidC [Azospira oryzae]PZP80165.1 MAG: membrane protein insertase YidC [Azospira oryzae]
MEIQRLILFLIFSMSLLFLWQAWQEHQRRPTAPPQAAPAAENPAPPVGRELLEKQAELHKAGESAPMNPGSTLTVTTDVLRADIQTLGGDVVRLELLKHVGAVDKKKPFVLFQRQGERVYVAQSGLIGDDLPSHKTLFTAAPGPYQLKPGEETLQVRLSAPAANGVVVEKIYTFRRGSYVVDVTFSIKNDGPAPIAPFAYYQFQRDGKPPEGDPKLLHTYTGPAVYTEETKFQKIAFSDIEKGKASLPKTATDGWIAMVQHYFLAAWLPVGNVSREFFARALGPDLYAAGVIVPLGAIEPGASRTATMRLYAGPQEQRALAKLAPGLDLVVDYGWLTVIAVPLFWVLDLFHRWVQNWGVAIILLTVLVKAMFYPLSAASYRSMARMKAITPRLQRIKELYGHDRQKLHQAMMDLYKEEKINPLGGCLPILIQIPVFIALYWVLVAAVELRNAPFIGWIQDLSAPDPYFVLPVVMGVTMWIQTKLNPTPPDPIQARVMQIMPVAFSVFFFFFPAGLVLYWLVNNILSIAQQWYITRRMERAAAAHAKR